MWMEERLSGSTMMEKGRAEGNERKRTAWRSEVDGSWRVGKKEVGVSHILMKGFEAKVKWMWVLILINERWQNVPPQNIPLWHFDYFEKQQTQEKLWKHSRSCPIVREICIYKEISIYKAVSLSVPGREGWLNYKKLLSVEKTPTSPHPLYFFL